MAWVRTDGKSTSSDPALSQLFQTDKTTCQGEREKVNLSDVTFTQTGFADMSIAAHNRTDAIDAAVNACMTDKGYVLVPGDQAEAQRQQFAAVEATKQAQQTAQAAPPKPAKKRPASATAQ
jgi:hypothetical protein